MICSKVAVISTENTKAEIMCEIGRTLYRRAIFI